MARKSFVRPGDPRRRGQTQLQTFEAVEITDPVEQARVDRIFDQAELDEVVERHGGTGAKLKPRFVRILYYELPAEARFDLLTQLTEELPPEDHRRFVAQLSGGAAAEGTSPAKQTKARRPSANGTKKQRRGA